VFEGLVVWGTSTTADNCRHSSYWQICSRTYAIRGKRTSTSDRPLLRMSFLLFSGKVLNKVACIPLLLIIANISQLLQIYHLLEKMCSWRQFFEADLEMIQIKAGSKRARSLTS
jgi:hypothetical protein